MFVSQKQNGNTWKKSFHKTTERSEFSNISDSQFSMILSKPSNLGKLTPHKASFRRSLSLSMGKGARCREPEVKTAGRLGSDGIVRCRGAAASVKARSQASLHASLLAAESRRPSCFQGQPASIDGLLSIKAQALASILGHSAGPSQLLSST